MQSPNVRTILGLLTGVVGLIAMIKLVGGAFTGSISTFAWVFVSLAMIPWVVYAAYRSRHSHLGRRSAIVVAGLILLGLAIVWLWTPGAVAALACSLGAFVLIWLADLPPRRPNDSQFVKIDELT